MTEAPRGPELRTDVCVVGAGPAGLTLADQVAAAGLDVVVLEAGPGAPPAGGVDVEGTDVVGLPYPLRRSRAAGVGGSSQRWDIDTPVGSPFVRLRALDPLDFAERPGLRRGWPISHTHLQSWYARAWETFGLREPSSAPSKEEGPLEPAVFCFGPARTFTEKLPDRLLRSPRVRLLTRTALVDVRTDDDEQAVSALQCVGPDGPVSVVARHYVLACGGVENARLLLASRSQRAEGLGNRHDQVGRCFMEHPHYASGLVVLEDGALLADREKWAVVDRDGQAQQRKHRLSQEVLEQHQLPGAALYVMPRAAGKPVSFDAAGRVDEQTTNSVQEVRMAFMQRRWSASSTRHLGKALRGSPRLAQSAVRQAMALRAAGQGRQGRRPVVFSLNVMAEQLPSPASRLRLLEERDALGRPRAALDWQPSQIDFAATRRRHQLAAPALEAFLGGRVLSLVDAMQTPHMGEGYHHMGTTRMSARPEHGVVDDECRVHGVRNLSVAGSSVFATSGYANPTLTVVALAHRLAHRLVKELAAPAQATR